MHTKPIAESDGKFEGDLEKLHKRFAGYIKDEQRKIAQAAVNS